MQTLQMQRLFRRLDISIPVLQISKRKQFGVKRRDVFANNSVLEFN